MPPAKAASSVGLACFKAWSPLNPQLIGRAPHPLASAVEDMRVNHGRGHAAVSQEFLHRADIIAILEQVGGE